jgi:peroxiredoxin Q/BCP
VSTQSATAPTGTPAPDFTLPKVGGGDVSLASYRGRPVVLAFLRGFA